MLFRMVFPVFLLAELRDLLELIFLHRELVAGIHAGPVQSSGETRPQRGQQPPYKLFVQLKPPLFEFKDVSQEGGVV